MISTFAFDVLCWYAQGSLNLEVLWVEKDLETCGCPHSQVFDLQLFGMLLTTMILQLAIDSLIMFIDHSFHFQFLKSTSEIWKCLLEFIGEILLVPLHMVTQKTCSKNLMNVQRSIWQGIVNYKKLSIQCVNNQCWLRLIWG